MSIPDLLRWQWQGYLHRHRSRHNLLLHIVLVPVFLTANIALLVALAQGTWLVSLAAVAAMGTAVALQGRSHRFEALPPEPFTGAANAVLRIFLEQWVTFPRFVLMGAWLGALRSAATADPVTANKSPRMANASTQ